MALNGTPKVLHVFRCQVVRVKSQKSIKNTAYVYDNVMHDGLKCRWALTFTNVTVKQVQIYI